MKRSNEIMKIAAVFLIAGLFFAACTLNEAGEYGTLVVVLPGGASHRTARAAGS
jgi:hypothetical protein